ncbi:Transthyretin-like family protein [Aphelenchoides besseyi]|nr:Transthyretin-like family protein [Aphelenchoides besseyi]KAI6179976.1 Transthyretin-like family protein [Aphelenchoides besseyi]KAI6208874.1 Transthyretin-like family protein [Aphelenchoides besseyi]
MLIQLLVFGLCSAIAVGLPVYHTAVSGSLFCNNDPYEGAHIELFDYDVLRPDEKLGEVQSGANGKFYVEGQREALVPMVPYVSISDKCSGQLVCRKVWIPVDYQWLDGAPKKVYAMGRVNLTATPQSTC